MATHLTPDPVSLLPDCGGCVERIAIAVPPQILARSGEAIDAAIAAALLNLAASFPEGVTLVVVTETAQEQLIFDWLGARLRCALEIAATATPGAMEKHNIWIQDTFYVGFHDGKAAYYKIYAERGGPHAIWLQRHDGTEVQHRDLFLAGGNMLVAEASRLVGCKAIADTVETILKGPQEDACRAIANLDVRPVHYYGYRDSDEAMKGTSRSRAALGRISARAHFPLDGLATKRPLLPLWRRVLVATLEEIRVQLRQLRGLAVAHQYHDFHIDLMVCLTGIVRDGAPILLLGDPEDASDPGTTPDWFDLGDLKAKLRATADRLEQRGFVVIRNPVPFRAMLDGSAFDARFYNNVIVENEVRAGSTKPLVWLPVFGDEDKPLASFDDENAKLWCGLGFDIVPVAGWGPLSKLQGGLRCASKVLARSGVDAIGE